MAAHAVAISAVMMIRMDLPIRELAPPTMVDFVPLPPEPAPNPPPEPNQAPRNSVIDRPMTVIPVPIPNIPQVDPTPLPLPDPGFVSRPGPTIDTKPTPAPVRMGPRFITPESDLKPPYPQQKLRLEEEAVLRLKLSIDTRGRVTSVEPVGRADPVFLAAARRHLIARWRYQPATEDGRPTASSTVITLRFQLD